jgi:antitoxin component HigA of HigAB toxin-antitoxin module
MGALTIDNKKYGRALARVLPRVIVTDDEHERLLGEVESLMDKGEHRTAEQDAALELMVRLIKDYDEQHYPLPDPGPREMLVYLMERRGLKQADLIPIFKFRVMCPTSLAACGPAPRAHGCGFGISSLTMDVRLQN